MRKYSALPPSHHLAIAALRREQEFRKKLTGRFTLLPSRYTGKFTIFDQELWRFLGVFTREEAEAEITRLRSPENRQCSSCGRPAESSEDKNRYCSACTRMHADGAVYDLHRAVADLRARAGAFAILTEAEQVEQLRALAIGLSPALPDVIELSDDQLICLLAAAADECERRACTIPLSDAARRAIEQEVIDGG